MDAIRRRGENISAWEVENALMLHSDIEEAAVIGVPSDLGSEEDVMAFVVMRPGCTPHHEHVIRFPRRSTGIFRNSQVLGIPG